MSNSPPRDGDDLSSRMRRSRIGSRGSSYDDRWANRNSEDIHQEVLEEAHARHLEVRERALRVQRNHELLEALEQERLRNIQEEARVKLEQARATEAARAQELQNEANSIPKLPPQAPIKPPHVPTTQILTSAPQLNPQAQPVPTAPQPQVIATPSPATQAPIPAGPEPTISVPNTTERLSASQAPKPIPAAPAPATSTPVAPTPVAPTLALPTPAIPAPALPTSAVSTPAVPTPAAQPANGVARSKSLLPDTVSDIEEYKRIFRHLKDLRKYVTNLGLQDSAFKKQTGEMRRGIRAAMGQLTAGPAGTNTRSLQAISKILRDSLTTFHSPPVDPGLLTVSRPEPSEGAKYNGETMPSLFLYLLNIFAKAVIAQFTEEAGVNPQFAEPIGIMAVTVFASPDFQWRGKTLISILIAKYVTVCPVLFGIRGSDRTEEGRARLGWKRNDNGSYITEQMHSARMTGLGAGYAAICLRDFSKSVKTNPWTPTNYWKALAWITRTPSDETSLTQYMVLKALISNNEQKFMKFYGNAARAALQVALVAFPKKARDPSAAAVASLSVVADKLKMDMGMVFVPA